MDLHKQPAVTEKVSKLPDFFTLVETFIMRLLFCVHVCVRVYLTVQYENIFFVPVKKIQNISSEFIGL